MEFCIKADTQWYLRTGSVYLVFEINRLTFRILHKQS